MTNPNSPVNRMKKSLWARWSAEEYPGATPRFQIGLFGKDVGIFLFTPLLSVIMFKACENAFSKSDQKKVAQASYRQNGGLDGPKSQIIDFGSHIPTSPNSGFVKRAPGSLVKLKLLNVVETYSNTPVHAQVVDSGLGANLYGGTLIGDAVSDTNFDRINITFKFAKDPRRENIALPISARALGLDGTLGVIAQKKEGFFTRGVYGSVPTAAQGTQGKTDGMDFRDIIVKALASGFMHEFGNDAQVERNRAQVLSLRPGIEFFAELNDFFPGSVK